MKTYAEEEQVSLFDPDSWSGKTCLEHSAQTRGGTSESSLKKQSESRSQKRPTFHYLSKESGRWLTAGWGMAGPLPTEFSMRSFGESPSVAVESRLSQILEDTPHQKYCLSAKAAIGILRRANKRGKRLPKEFRIALENQSGLRGDTIVHHKDENPLNNHAVYDARGNGDGKTVCTLTGDHQNRVTDYTAIVMETGQAGAETTEDIGPNLNCNHEQPIVRHTLLARANDPHRADMMTYPNTDGVVRRLTPLECERLQGYPSEKKIDISKMNKDEYIAWNLSVGNIIADAEKGKVFATRGPGGKKLTQPKELTGTDVNGYNVISIRNGTTKLLCRTHRIIWISVNGVIPDGYCIDHINNNKKDNRIENLQLLTPAENSKKAASDGLYRSGEDNVATKISPELYDEIAYLYNCSDFTMKELAEVYGVSKSRIHQIIKEVGYTDIGTWTDSKDKQRECSDAARYKALGNSIALPPWKWVLKRLCACYERDATMASLFDGISGFCLIWAQLNGMDSVKWCSEIEEFPIAVCKRHFGDEKTGEKGDLSEILLR